MAFCEQCGAEASMEAKFCGNCGKQIGGKSIEDLASEVEIFKKRVSCREILSSPNLRLAREGLERRKYFNELLQEDAVGGLLAGANPPNAEGEMGHYGNGVFNLLLTKNYIALFNENGGPVLNGKLGFKASTGNEWGLIFPISELRSVQLQKGVWTMSFSDGYVQEAEFWYLVIEPKAPIPGDDKNAFSPHDLVEFPNRNSFKFGWNFEKNRCPHAIWTQYFRAINPDKGDGYWYIALALEESGDFKKRRVLASALASEISHYPEFQVDETSVITSRTHHIVGTANKGPQGFAFSFVMVS